MLMFEFCMQMKNEERPTCDERRATTGESAAKWLGNKGADRQERVVFVWVGSLSLCRPVSQSHSRSHSAWHCTGSVGVVAAFAGAVSGSACFAA